MVGGAPNVKVPDPLPVQPVVGSVITTLYTPATAVAVKLATFPGLGAPAGTVQA
jgi:hypothetical protein